jgi:dipeptidyl-peptidase-4
MTRKFLVAILFVLPLFTFAQKKKFTFNEIFAGGFPTIFKTLPVIEGWADDNHYIEVQTDDNGNKTRYSVDVVTGKRTAYQPSKDETPEVEEDTAVQNITLSPDGRFQAYTKNHNLFIRDVATKQETALTNDGSETILNGYASWIYYEEILGRSSHYKAFWWSPDSKHLAYMRFDQSHVPIFPIYFADGQHGYLEYERYPKAGDKNPDVKIGITDVTNRKTVWADFDEKKDQYFGTPHWTPTNQLHVMWLNRGQDSLNVYTINNSNGSKKLVYSEAQSTWITLDDDNRFTFLSAGKGFIMKSDKDGWQNLYLFDESGKQQSKITDGNFWSTQILYVDEKNSEVYIRARKENSARFDLYRASFKGNKVTRLSSGNFTFDSPIISPTGKYIIATYSNISTPPAIVLIDNKGKIVREIANSKTSAVDGYAIPDTKLVRVKSSDGNFDLPMTITFPIDFDSTKKYPVWISIYGGPNFGTVYDRWKPAGGLQQWWAQEGVIQVAMDNRSSGHFGRKGMNYIFKQLGKWEVEDYMTCAKWLKNQRWVDNSKVGITGGSFGGYVTCMALTYGADVFTHGIADYSVTDWSLYDSHYTERYMKTPQQNPEGYKNTSVFTYVPRYKGMLRIVHGSTDDNVHMQNTIQLIDALQDHYKIFELMIYPDQRHGIGNTKKMHNLIENCRFIYKYMLEKPLPQEFGVEN